MPAARKSPKAAQTARQPKASPQPTPATPLCDTLRAQGQWNPNWDAMYELDPAWSERFMAMGLMPMTSGVLDAKTLEFLAIAVDASCTHMYGPGVRRHIRRALEVGATPQEITAVLQCVSVLGIHSMSLGAPMLIEEIAAHRSREGRTRHAGKRAARPVAVVTA